MESRISLALAHKLRLLFERPDRFLAFPMGTALSYAYLGFMKDPATSGLSAQDQLNYTIHNTLPNEAVGTSRCRLPYAAVTSRPLKVSRP